MRLSCAISLALRCDVPSVLGISLAGSWSTSTPNRFVGSPSRLAAQSYEVIGCSFLAMLNVPSSCTNASCVPITRNRACGFSIGRGVNPQRRASGSNQIVYSPDCGMTSGMFWPGCSSRSPPAFPRCRDQFPSKTNLNSYVPHSQNRSSSQRFSCWESANPSSAAAQLLNVPASRTFSTGAGSAQTVCEKVRTSPKQTANRRAGRDAPDRQSAIRNPHSAIECRIYRLGAAEESRMVSPTERRSSTRVSRPSIISSNRWQANSPKS